MLHHKRFPCGTCTWLLVSILLSSSNCRKLECDKDWMFKTVWWTCQCLMARSLMRDAFAEFAVHVYCNAAALHQVKLTYKMLKSKIWYCCHCHTWSFNLPNSSLEVPGLAWPYDTHNYLAVDNAVSITMSLSLKCLSTHMSVLSCWASTSKKIFRICLSKHICALLTLWHRQFCPHNCLVPCFLYLKRQATCSRTYWVCLAYMYFGYLISIYWV